jgi:hypothetical protein
VGLIVEARNIHKHFLILKVITIAESRNEMMNLAMYAGLVTGQKLNFISCCPSMDRRLMSAHPSKYIDDYPKILMPVETLISAFWHVVLITPGHVVVVVAIRQHEQWVKCCGRPSSRCRRPY